MRFGVIFKMANDTILKREKFESVLEEMVKNHDIE